MQEMMKTILGLALAASCIAMAPASAGTNGSWESFSKDGRCWAAALPASSTGSIPGRASPYLSIQNQPAEGVKGSVALVAGYPKAGESGVVVAVDGEAFDVLPFGGAAFTASGKPEAKLIAAMRHGKELSVTWTDPSGASATDLYSLAGFSASKDVIDADCR